jgi:hypothetical protein
MSIEYLTRRAWFVGLHTSFTHTRREHGLGAAYGVPDAPLVVRQPSLARRAVGRGQRIVRSRASRAAHAIRPLPVAERMARDVQRQLGEEYAAGYLWHQQQLATIPHLRAYVCRSDFMDANGVLLELTRSR